MKFGNNAKAHRRIADLANFLQIKNLRLDALKEKTRILHAEFYCELLADAVEVYARSEMLLAFVRSPEQDHHVFGLVPDEPKLDDLQLAIGYCAVTALPWNIVRNKLAERCKQKNEQLQMQTD